MTKFYERANGMVFDTVRDAAEFHNVPVQFVQVQLGRLFFEVSDEVAEVVNTVPGLAPKGDEAKIPPAEGPMIQRRLRVMEVTIPGDPEPHLFRAISAVMDFTGLTRYRVQKILKSGDDADGIYIRYKLVNENEWLEARYE